MKQLSIGILFICMLAASFSNVLIIAAYKINRQYLSKTLCVNKASVSMHCNGRCYLNKQLAKAEKPSSPLNTKSSERFELQYLNTLLPTSSNNIKAKKRYTTRQQNFTPQQFILLSFRPPQA